MSKNRRILSLKEKINIIEVYEQEKLSVRDLAKRFNIGKTQSASIIKKREELLDKWHKNVNINLKRSFLRPEGLRIDTLTFEWFQKARSKGIPVSGPIIRAKAKEIAQNLEYQNFNASSGWLEKFRKRHSIAFKAISGEAGSVNADDVKTFLEKVPSLIKDYSPKDIFNADETGLFFRALPQKSLALKNEKCVGGKLSKERITILFCASMSGEKEKILMISKSKKPRAFKNLKINSLPVTWKSNKKAWMTASIMSDWLHDFDRRMGYQRRKILLFLDNACCHPKDVELNNIKMVFLPPNCTSVVQPLDQGIIKNFKAFYRTNLINTLLSEIDSAESLSSVTKAVDLLDALYFANNAWQKVTEETIKNCFRKAGITHGNNELISNREKWDVEDEIPLSILVEILRNCQEKGIDVDNLGDYFDVDNNVLTEDADDESAAPIENGTSMECFEVCDDSEEEIIDPRNIINHQQAKTAVKDLQEFVKYEGDAIAMDMLSQLEIHFQQALIKKRTRQSTIFDFFKVKE